MYWSGDEIELNWRMIKGQEGLMIKEVTVWQRPEGLSALKQAELRAADAQA